MTSPQHRMSGGDYVRGCRCEVCRSANRDRVRRRRLERFAARILVDGRPVSVSPGIAHGSAATYTNHGCRCVPCSDANAVKCSQYREAS